MKRPLYLMIILIMALPVLADEPIDYEDLSMSVKLSNIIEITPEAPNYKVDYIDAKLSWVPRETYRQKLTSLTTEPSSTVEEDELGFLWNYPKEKELWIRVTGAVKTNADYFQIKKKVDFPIRDLDSGLSIYLQEREIIDFNNDIETIAAELAEGKDDLYDVVFAIVTWVNSNINYSLTTLTADASQKSSWVLENRKGVCDEMTSLVISMLRTLGIPARFVYGYSYTNAYEENWGAHGWAEVYFPGYGWVPFDPTYAEYGYVDASHIKMGESIDARRPSLKYSMKTFKSSVKSGFLDINVDIVGKENLLEPEAQLDAEFYSSEIGYGSYNLLTLNLKNNDDYYKPVSVRLLGPREVEIFENVKTALLKPKEQKKIHWLVRVQDDLKSGFLYTFPFRIITSRGGEINLSFTSTNTGYLHDREEFLDIIQSNEKEFVKEYSKNIGMNCEASSSSVYVNKDFTVDCDIENKGNKNLRNVEICIEECEKVNLDAGQEHSFIFEKAFDTPGFRNVIVSGENEAFSKTSYVKINVIDEGSLKIDVSAPAKINYRERIEIKFNLTKTSHSVPKNLDVSLEFQDAEQGWEIEALERPARYSVGVGTEGFAFNNEFTITASYEDDLGKKYVAKEKFIIKLEDLSVKEWLLVGINTLGHKISSVFT